MNLEERLREAISAEEAMCDALDLQIVPEPPFRDECGLLAEAIVSGNLDRIASLASNKTIFSLSDKRMIVSLIVQQVLDKQRTSPLIVPALKVVLGFSEENPLPFIPFRILIGEINKVRIIEVFCDPIFRENANILEHCLWFFALHPGVADELLVRFLQTFKTNASVKFTTNLICEREYPRFRLLRGLAWPAE